MKRFLPWLLLSLLVLGVLLAARERIAALLAKPGRS